MKNDWVMFDFVRAFMPDWLANVFNLKVLTVATLALMIFVIVLKARG